MYPYNFTNFNCRGSKFCFYTACSNYWLLFTFPSHQVPPNIRIVSRSWPSVITRFVSANINRYFDTLIIVFSEKSPFPSVIFRYFEYSHKMVFSRIIHNLTNNTYNKSKIRPSMRKIYQFTNKVLVSSIVHRKSFLLNSQRFYRIRGGVSGFVI